jgi:hypothetical protein
MSASLMQDAGPSREIVTYTRGPERRGAEVVDPGTDVTEVSR